MNLSEPWLQLDGEDPKHYQSFIHYRSLPQPIRTVRNAAAAELGFPVPYEPTNHTDAERRRHVTRNRKLEQYSGANSWIQRATEYDDHLAQVRVAERVDYIREMSDRHAMLGRLLQDAAMTAMQSLMSHDGTVLKRGQRRDGFLPTSRDVLTAVEIGVRIERAAVGVEHGERGDITPAVLPDRAAPARELYESHPKVAGAMANLLLEARRAERERATSS